MTFSTVRRIEFRDTDAAGIVHFSAFFPMMEVAEHEMLRSLGISVLPRANDRISTDQADNEFAVTWPRVAARCDYRAAAHFEDMLAIAVRVHRIGTSSVEYKFQFTRDGDTIAEGSMTAVCCRLPENPANGSLGGLQKVPIPNVIRELLSKHQ